MDQQGKVLRLGAWAILFAVMVKLSSLGFFQPLGELLENPNIQSFLIYIETGRKVRFSPSSEDFDRESPVPQESVAPLPSPGKVCASDAKVDLRPEGQGQGTRGRAAPREPRASSPREAWEDAGGRTQPPHWLVLGASPPLCWRCGPSLGDTWTHAHSASLAVEGAAPGSPARLSS